MKDYNYAPDRWLMLEIVTATETLYKVFGTWGGGYLSSESWRINSGITSVTRDEEYYYFKGYSGNVYKCYKGGYGITGSSNFGVFDKIVNMQQESVSVKCIPLEDVEDLIAGWLDEIII